MTYMDKVKCIEAEIISLSKYIEEHGKDNINVRLRKNRLNRRIEECYQFIEIVNNTKKWLKVMSDQLDEW